MLLSLEQIQQYIHEKTQWQFIVKDEAIIISNENNIDAYLAISGEQIIVETILFSEQDIVDTAAINEKILMTHEYIPLSTIGIKIISNTKYYVAFGALSTHSDLDVLHIEIETLFNNIDAMIELYQDYLKEEVK